LFNAPRVSKKKGSLRQPAKKRYPPVSVTRASRPVETGAASMMIWFAGDDFFIDKDVCSIVLEVPNSALGPRRVRLWAHTLDDAGGVWVQADRGALPAQAVFLVGSERDGYHAGEPANDARFIAVFAHALEHAGGYAPEEARRVAGTLLPDMLSYDPTCPASFPSNGRTLTDDAADAFLAVLTNGKLTGDNVGAHVDLLAEFPYLGPPHNKHCKQAEDREQQMR
jgi:hypothetical protein